MAIKLIAVDLDDTLINHKREISPRVAATIRQAVAQGVQVAIATGRMYCSALPFANQLDLNVPLVTYNGALIKEALTEEVLLHRPIDLSVATEVLGVFKQQKWYIQSYVDDKLYVEKMTEKTRMYMDIAGVNAIEAGDRLYQPWTAPTKMLAIVEPNQAVKVRELLTNQFKGRLFVTGSKPNFLEMIDPQVNKGTGLAFLADKLHIKQQEIMAVGDSFNDLDMLLYAGVGVAMGNAPDAVKAKADAVTLRNDEDGVAEAIERYVIQAR